MNTLDHPAAITPRSRVRKMRAAAMAVVVCGTFMFSSNADAATTCTMSGKTKQTFTNGWDSYTYQVGYKGCFKRADGSGFCTSDYRVAQWRSFSGGYRIVGEYTARDVTCYFNGK